MRRVILSAAFAISTLTACIYLQQPAHAGDVVRNYDADGNYIGYSERETPEETASRTHFEYMMAVQQDEARKRCFQMWAKTPNAFCHY